ncbi:(deoxy)nucleoside triphosphate pyrophosphohydrolase [Arthrobacter sp.]|uniref:(deoxy)nucleoside triphosphate pyrophosphohydrolase n=1 Tax=Arthrobacter sp. TaxID=1667 RepID=UPI00289D8DEF|nr:(deoxy)nucleoside triphosphate pyrophosphohydrolase [Arthrobacter sp.]
MNPELKQVVGAAIIDDLQNPSSLLAARRSAPEHYAGMWEFPGGKVEPGESCEAALHRELAEELGVEVALGAEITGPLAQGWPLNQAAAMRVWLVQLTAGEPLPLEDHDELRWVQLDSPELAELPWIPADLPIVAAMLRAAGVQNPELTD